MRNLLKWEHYLDAIIRASEQAERRVVLKTHIWDCTTVSLCRRRQDYAALNPKQKEDGWENVKRSFPKRFKRQQNKNGLAMPKPFPFA